MLDELLSWIFSSWMVFAILAIVLLALSAEKNNVASQHPDKVAALQNRIEELAKDSTKPLFLVEQFKAMQKGLQGEPALPNEDTYYEEEGP